MVQVKAKNSKYESNDSAVALLHFDDAAFIEGIKGLYVEKTSEQTITLSWQKVNDAEGYIIRPRANIPYPAHPSNKTTDNKFIGKLFLYNLVNINNFVSILSILQRIKSRLQRVCEIYKLLFSYIQ